MQIYDNKNIIQLVIVCLALVIGLASIIYTNSLVTQLAEREKNKIELFKRAQEIVIASSGSSEALTFLFDKVIGENHSIPVILIEEGGTIPDEGKLPYHRNIDFPKKASDEAKRAILRKELKVMKEEYKPLNIKVEEVGINQFIYFRNSSLITQLKYYPFVQLTALALLAGLAYVIFSTTRKSEQNRLWVGLAKETAHQLGTPISSLMAWIEVLRTDPNFDQSFCDEMEKDTKRLEMITARFSNIGSEPSMKVANAGNVVVGIVQYLQKRVSSKVKIKVTPRFSQDLNCLMNVPLFEWVIENLCKNAVDAMSGKGKIDIYVQNSKDNTQVIIDVNDTGKGIHPSKIKQVFRPGFTTKKRGWGLGLTLVKRIVEEYHRGKIYVRKSELNVGTSFRIIIPKNQGKIA
ncbi:MAG: sensor histidine kinase [Flammeovirgaceae bacterium]